MATQYLLPKTNTNIQNMVGIGELSNIDVINKGVIYLKPPTWLNLLYGLYPLTIM